MIERTPRETALGPCCAGAEVDAYTLHRGEVDDDSIVTGAESGDVVATSSNGDGQVVAASEPQRGDHVGDSTTTSDTRRSAVDRAVPHAPGLVVGGVAG
jgi:CRP-like cAMP-binding protein